MRDRLIYRSYRGASILPRTSGGLGQQVVFRNHPALFTPDVGAHQAVRGGPQKADHLPFSATVLELGIDHHGRQMKKEESGTGSGITADRHLNVKR